MRGVSIRIEAVRWRPFRLPLRSRFEAAHGTFEERDGVLVQLEDDRGLVGTGEATPLPTLGDGDIAVVQARLEELAPAIIAAGRPPACIEGPGGASLACALDVAMLDLVGQRLGLPIAALLEESPAASVEVNALIGDGSSDETERWAREAEAAGYRTVKLKVGVRSIRDDAVRVAALRYACPELRLRLDVNGAWDPTMALRALDGLTVFGIELLEQPVPVSAIDGLAALRDASTIPLAADESVSSVEAAERLLALDTVDALVLKQQRLGGLQPALEVARRAQAAAVPCIVTTSIESSIGTAAAVHLAAAIEGIGAGGFAHGLSTGELLAADVVAQTLVPLGGALAVPEAPGLGIEVDEEHLEAVATGAWCEVRRG